MKLYELEDGALFYTNPHKETFVKLVQCHYVSKLKKALKKDDVWCIMVKDAKGIYRNPELFGLNPNLDVVLVTPEDI